MIYYEEKGEAMMKEMMDDTLLTGNDIQSGLYTSEPLNDEEKAYILTKGHNLNANDVVFFDRLNNLYLENKNLFAPFVCYSKNSTHTSETGTFNYKIRVIIDVCEYECYVTQYNQFMNDNLILSDFGRQPPIIYCNGEKCRKKNANKWCSDCYGDPDFSDILHKTVHSDYITKNLTRIASYTITKEFIPKIN